MNLDQLILYLSALQSVMPEDAAVSLEINDLDYDGPRCVVGKSVSVIVNPNGSIVLSGISEE